ncbi:MAG: two-component system sensor histidine kinase NtrB [Desulfobulbus sp.]|jgi:two-component system sensor histidine kinase HydH
MKQYVRKIGTWFSQHFHHPASLITSSPWLLAASAGLLIMIVVTFAFHNLRLEERLMTNAMLQKSITLMRVIHSGARASFFDALRKDRWRVEGWEVHVQRVIDHLADDPEVRFLALTDLDGKVLAHSNHALIGSMLPVPEKGVVVGEGERQHRLMYSIGESRGHGRVFQTVRTYAPTLPPLRPGMRGGSHFPRGDDGLRSSPGFRPPLLPFPGMGQRFLVQAGLDMTEFDRILARLRMQIFMLSLAMLLVGLGSWFSLAAVQGYRMSQKILQEMQAFTALLIAKLPVGVIATDTGDRITTWNQTIVRLTGIQQAEAAGKRAKEVLPPELLRFFEETAGEATGLSASSSTVERTIRLEIDGRRYELRCHALVITDSDHACLGRVLLVSDETEIRSLEQRMRENERLAAVGRMAGGVAHEVRNPLSSIKGLALLLKNKFPSGSREQYTADLLIQETERMNRTITEMLSFTRPPTLQLKRVELEPLLGRCFELIRSEADEGGVELVVHVEPGVRAVCGDVDRLQQVLMNILLNALQAMRGGGLLTVTVENLSAQEVEVQIKDTGEGIAPELLSQVFFPYFTTKNKGTGIGLAISQKIIVDHGGAIELDSTPGQGTTVSIRLPVFRETA